MNTEEDLNILADIYVSQMEKRNIDHPKIMLGFSGIPGSEKSEIAQRLAEDLQAQLLQHDHMRIVISKYGYDPRKFSMVLLTRRIVKKIIESDLNKFIVLDLSIDRTWERFFDYNKTLGTRPIVIRINVPIETLRKKLAEREDYKHFSPDRFEGFVMDFDNSKKHVKADFELNPDSNYKDLLAGLKKLIAIN